MIKVKELVRLKGDPVWTVDPKQTARVAIHIMNDQKIGALPVLDNGKLVGIVSERDIVRIVSRETEAYLDMPVSSFMTKNVITASGETTLEDCMEIMTENHFRHLPILEGDELVGIVSIRDLVAKLLMNKDALIIDLEKYISGKR
ncbi:MAG: CBS domain-containing protein [Anaerolineaceae bacterium]